MIGSVLLEGVGETTLTLEMLGWWEHSKISKCLEDCLEVFIDNLEGIYRPMELVSADFINHMVEITIRRFFRVVRSVKTSATQESLATPQKCTDSLTSSFNKIIDIRPSADGEVGGFLSPQRCPAQRVDKLRPRGDGEV
jgi:hypothetical protein